MKYKSMLVASIAVSIFSIQSQAAETLCDINLQKLDEVLLTATQRFGADTTNYLTQTRKEAMEAQEAGDIDKCIGFTQQALSRFENASMGGGGNK